MSISLEQASEGSLCLSKVGTGIGSTTSQLKTVAADVTTVDGIFQAAKGATASIPLTLAAGVPALQTVNIGYKCSIGLWLQGANWVVSQSVPMPFTSATDKVGPPPIVSGAAMVGFATVAAVSAAFIPATTAFSAAGVTTAYTDTMTAPGGAVA